VQAVDPDNVGHEYWLAGCPPNDDRAKVLQKRTDCYQLVLRSLNSFKEKAVRAQTPALPRTLIHSETTHSVGDTDEPALLEGNTGVVGEDGVGRGRRGAGTGKKKPHIVCDG
jgi:hypothetical protein